MVLHSPILCKRIQNTPKFKHCKNLLQTPPSLINRVSDPLPPTALRRRHAQTARDSSSSYKIGYVIVTTKTFLIPKGIKIASLVQKLWPFY